MKNFYLLCFLTALGCAQAQIVSIPDADFKAKLLMSAPNVNIAENLAGVQFKIDSNSDGEIQVSEAMQVSYLNLYSASIASLDGIQSFANLEYLKCDVNQLTSLNLAGLNMLATLYCGYNNISSLDVTNLPALRTLWCNANNMDTLNIAGMTTLEILYCDHNDFTSLNLSGLSAIEFIDCTYNNLITLDASGHANLATLYCEENNLTSINLTELPAVTVFKCFNNNLTTLDVSGMTSLQAMFAYSNNLQTLFMKNGIDEPSLLFYNNPNLLYICTDESQVAEVEEIIQGNEYALFDCSVSSYCSFTPGGAYYAITGNNKFDAAGDGCAATDPIYPNLKFNVTDGTNNSTLAGGISGYYFLPVTAGTHTITPILENPEYFSVSPTSAVITFPGSASPVTQNFCVVSNGIHNDLAVFIVPLTTAFPGNDARYQVYCRNKGSNTLSATLNFTFNDNLADYVSAVPAPLTQAGGSMSWQFTDLAPLDYAVFEVTVNLNTPTDNPPVTTNTLLQYTAQVSPGMTDELPEDNTFTLNVYANNSFDPNEKVCLEGRAIPISSVGKYVHYIIRCENTGTANAQNIVIKDMIDLTKYDIGTLIPLSGSHPFTTRISDEGKVEFIFENINLPFDNANNDAYVAFKIKTRPMLVNGNTFSNTASIYFDYNFPIVTNTATTTISALAVKDFDFDDYFAIHPNPVDGLLTISLKKEISISSISIYNPVGQLLSTSIGDKSSVDVSQLTAGNYFVKITTSKGVANAQFIKQ